MTLNYSVSNVWELSNNWFLNEEKRYNIYLIGNDFYGRSLWSLVLYWRSGNVNNYARINDQKWWLIFEVYIMVYIMRNNNKMGEIPNLIVLLVRMYLIIIDLKNTGGRNCRILILGNNLRNNGFINILWILSDEFILFYLTFMILLDEFIHHFSIFSDDFIILLDELMRILLISWIILETKHDYLIYFICY
jgi:hypothetical protein